MLGRKFSLNPSRQPRKPASFRPHLEALEDRALPALTLGTLIPPDAVEGQAFTNTALLDFSDLDGEPITNYSAKITWGDGSTNTITSVASAAGQIVANASGGFDVLGSHTYADDLSGATFQVQVIDTDGETQTASFTPFSVAEAELSATGVDVTALECFSTSQVTVATFVDLGGPEPVATYSGTIDWGDESTSTGADVTITLGSDGETFSVQGSHTYESEGTYTILVTIVHENGVSAETISTATVQKNVGILILDPTTTTLQDTGGGTITVTGECSSVVINSSASDAARIVGNSVLEADHIEVVGDVFVTNNANIVGELETGAEPFADPFTLLEPPTAAGDTFTDVHITNSQVVTLEPGTYVGGIKITGQAVVTLEPGIYFLQGGGFFVDGQAVVTGEEVLIYSAPEETGHAIHFTGDSRVTLSAPTDGDYKGIAVWQDRDSEEKILVSGQSVVRITGTVYAAEAEMQVSGQADVGLEGSETDEMAAHLIVGDLRVVGGGIVTVDTSNNHLQPLPTPLDTLQAEFGFHSTGNFLTNATGNGEKWFLDRHNRWFALTPTGELVQWDGNSFVTSQQNSHWNLGRIVFADPTLLFDGNVVFSPGARAELAHAQAEAGFHFGGNYWKNWGGHNEKWFQDRAGNWYAITASGDVFRGNLTTHVMDLDPQVYDDPSLLFDAAVLVSHALQQQLSELQAANGFHFSGYYWQNWTGHDEKWFQDRTGRWFAITPDGDLFSGNLSNFVTNLTPIVYDDPTLLFNARVVVSDALKQQLAQLQADHGFHFGGSYWFNWSGLGEKWFQDRTNRWFAITPAGDIWDGQNLGKRNKTPLAHVDPIVYDDPNLLFNA